jgi:hyperosmotically inducible protein
MKGTKVSTNFITFALCGVLTVLLVTLPTLQVTAQERTQLRNTSQVRGQRGIAWLTKEVRHELLTLPYYGVFDWLEFQIQDTDTVVLRGFVTRPTTKSDAEARVKDIESVERVVNQIEVLPVSPNDDRLRRVLYRAVYDFDGPLFRYGIGSRQAIHIIVRNGHVTLKGIVDSEADKNLAYTRASAVSGVFSVTNHLVVGKSD